MSALNGISLFISCMLTACLFGCAKNTAEPALTDISFESDTVKIKLRTTKPLKFITSPADYPDANLVWSSSDTLTATVSPLGIVMSKKTGQVAVHVKGISGKASARCIVKISLK